MEEFLRQESGLVIGVALNNLASSNYGLPELIRAARVAEELGFDAVWVSDAPLGRRTVAAWDPLVCLTAIACNTQRVRLATGILQPQLRNPVFLAAAWATLDVLSNGRTVLGVGIGAGKNRLVDRQYDAAYALRAGAGGDPDVLFRGRGTLFDECLDVIRQLWSQDKITYRGRFIQFSDVTLGAARPRQVPHPPILIAQGNYFPRDPGGPMHYAWKEELAGQYRLGRHERVARLGDGWITVHVTPEEYRVAWAAIARSTETVGRNPAQLIRAFDCWVNVNRNREVALREGQRHLEDYHGPPVPEDVASRWLIAGSPEEVAAALLRYVEAGVSWFELVIASPDQFGQMRALAEDVLPVLREDGRSLPSFQKHERRAAP